uniref:Uncharacterized protein n=1 Tax=Staphylococcus aureus TaxID=1280 RepID=E4PYK4_STAAU|nr:hypothetical protein SUM_0031 [Staphylococcus aureus]
MSYRCLMIVNLRRIELILYIDEQNKQQSRKNTFRLFLLILYFIYFCYNK